MSSRSRLVLGLTLGALFLAATGTVAWTAAAFLRGGRIAVQVREGGGAFVSVQVPAGIVPVALAVVPDSCLRKAAREIGPWWPAIHAAVAAIVEVPDGLYLEIEARDETVTVGKREGELFVHIAAGADRVDVTLPVRTLRTVVRKLGRNVPVEPLPGRLIPPPGPAI